MRVVLEHPPRKVTGNGFDHMIRLSGFEQASDDRVRQIVEAEPANTGRVPQRMLGRIPFAPRLRRIERVVRVRAPQRVVGIFVPKFVGAFDQLLDRAGTGLSPPARRVA